MVYELDAEEAKALDAFRTLTAEQRRSLAESEKGAAATKRQTQGIDKFKNAIMGFAATFSVLATVKSLVGSIADGLEKSVSAAKDSVDELTKFQALGSLTPADRELILQHAGRLKVEDASKIAFTARSAGAKDKDLVEILKEANVADKLGEGPETIQSVASTWLAHFKDRSLQQVSSMITALAKDSPLDIQQMASIAPRVSGIAGATEIDKVQGLALTSAIAEAMGSAKSPELAATAAKQFMVKRLSDKASAYFRGAGLEGAGIVAQIERMSQDVKSGALTEKKITNMFGEKAGPSLLSLLRSETAMAGLRPEAAGGLLAMTIPRETSEMARRAAELGLNDPAWAKLREAEFVEAQRDVEATRRGYEQAPIELTKQKAMRRYETRKIPFYGEAGDWKAGLAFQTLAQVGGPMFNIVRETAAFVLELQKNREAVAENTQAVKEGAKQSAGDATPRRTEQVSLRPEGGF